MTDKDLSIVCCGWPLAALDILGRFTTYCACSLSSERAADPNRDADSLLQVSTRTVAPPTLMVARTCRTSPTGPQLTSEVSRSKDC